MSNLGDCLHREKLSNKYFQEDTGCERWQIPTQLKQKWNKHHGDFCSILPFWKFDKHALVLTFPFKRLDVLSLDQTAVVHNATQGIINFSVCGSSFSEVYLWTEWLLSHFQGITESYGAAIHALSVSQLTDGVVSRSKRMMLDTLGVGLLGSRTDVFNKALQYSQVQCLTCRGRFLVYLNTACLLKLLLFMLAWDCSLSICNYWNSESILVHNVYSVNLLVGDSNVPFAPAFWWKLICLFVDVYVKCEEQCLG